jgi:hypothetical protein
MIFGRFHVSQFPELFFRGELNPVAHIAAGINPTPDWTTVLYAVLIGAGVGLAAEVLARVSNRLRQ